MEDAPTLLKKSKVRMPRIYVYRNRSCQTLYGDHRAGLLWERVTEVKVSILLESELSSSNLILSSSFKTFRKYYQSCIARQCTVTWRFHRVFEDVGNEFKSEPWFDSRWSQCQNGQTRCIVHCCESDGWSRWLRWNSIRLVTCKNRAIQKTLKRFQRTAFCYNLKPAQRRLEFFWQ